MSAETLQLLRTMDRSNLQVQIGLQCAPLLAGIKISNLLTAPTAMQHRIDRIFQKSGICSHLLYRAHSKSTFFLYRKIELEQILRQPEVLTMMKELGYPSQNLWEVLNLAAQRYEAYMKKRKDFPHELGLLLGYPVQDVAGFMAHKGKNFLYSGYWKVYGNLQECLDLFCQYDIAKEQVIHMMSHGMSVRDILSSFDHPFSRRQIAV